MSGKQIRQVDRILECHQNVFLIVGAKIIIPKLCRTLYKSHYMLQSKKKVSHKNAFVFFNMFIFNQNLQSN